MDKRERTLAVLLAAGSGKRMESKTKKHGKGEYAC